MEDQARLAMENILEYIKRSVNEKLPKQEFGIPHIKQVAEEVASISSTYWKQKCPLDPKEIERLQNIAVVVYLRYWLQYDEKARVTIPAYVRYGFSSSRRKIASNIYDVFPTQERSFRNHKKKIMEMFSEVKRQAQKENRPYTPIADGIGRNYAFPFEIMAYIDISTQGYLSLENLAFRRQETMKSTANKKANTALIRAYNDLMLFLEKLDTDCESIIKDPQICRQYVVYCMFLHGWECANRFMLAAKVAEFLDNNDLLSLYENDKNSEGSIKYNKSLRFFGRYVANEHKLFERKSRYVQEDYPFDVLNYTHALNVIHGEETTDNISAITREEYLRTVFVDILTVLTQIYPFESNRSWTDTDFINAAKFFYNDYPILKTFHDVNFPDEDGKFYANCRVFYTIMEQIENSALLEARDKLSTKKKDTAQ